jgi:glutathione S-transferase
MPKAHTVFDELARQLRDAPFFVGDSISLADILLAPQLDFFRTTPEWEPLSAKHENLRAWIRSASPAARISQHRFVRWQFAGRLPHIAGRRRGLQRP